jgi:hypothetical protein
MSLSEVTSFVGTVEGAPVGAMVPFGVEEPGVDLSLMEGSRTTGLLEGGMTSLRTEGDSSGIVKRVPLNPFKGSSNIERTSSLVRDVGVG